MAGYFKIYRKIAQHWVWKDKPFSSGQAWIDLLILAAWKQDKGQFRGVLYDLQPGQMVTSDQSLANRWGWTRKRVRSFLQRLENNEMLNNRRNNRKSIITICKWEDYQDIYNGKGTTEVTSEGQQRGTQTVQQEVQQNFNDTNGFSTAMVQQKYKQREQERVHNNKEDKKERNEIINSIFDFWNTQGIILHRKLTYSIEKAICKTLNNFSADEIITAITRYSEANKSGFKPCEYKWGLKEFLTREKGIAEFVDEGSKWVNYLDWNNRMKSTNELTMP
jgi:DNA-binding GntR family transcriptional regulator